MNTEFEQLNSFDNLLSTEDLSISLRIKRDLFLYLQQRFGASLYSRLSGGGLNNIENEVNSYITDGIIKTQIVQAVGEYNLTVVPELRAIVGSDMIGIRREENLVEILVVFVPMKNPSVTSVDSVMISVPTIGG